MLEVLLKDSNILGQNERFILWHRGQRVMEENGFLYRLNGEEGCLKTGWHGAPLTQVGEERVPSDKAEYEQLRGRLTGAFVE